MSHPPLRQLGVILSDRGSRYAVSGAPVRDRPEIIAAVTLLKRQRSYAKATHNSWAANLTTGALKADDGETGAAMVILRMLERAELVDHLIIVTRWYGGKKLGGDRFRRVQDCVRTYLDQMDGSGV